MPSTAALSTVLKNEYPLREPVANDAPRVVKAAKPTTVTGPRYQFNNDDVYSMLFNGVDSLANNARLGESALKAFERDAEISTKHVEAEAIQFPVSSDFVEAMVIGGMGPLAGNDMANKIFKAALKKTTPGTDQEHLPFSLLNQAHLIADRTTYYNSFKGDRNDKVAWSKYLTAKKRENPLWGVLELSRRASTAGAHLKVSPCNSIHNAHAVLAAESDVPYLHIADSVMYNLSKKYENREEPLNILIVGTASTVSGELYQNRAKDIAAKYSLPKINWVIPGKEAQDSITNGIYKGVKASDMTLAAKLIHKGEKLAIEKAKADGIEVQLRGAFCTEIDPAEQEMTPQQKDDFGKTTSLDATQTLAEMAVDASMALRQANDILDARAIQELDKRNTRNKTCQHQNSDWHAAHLIPVP